MAILQRQCKLCSTNITDENFEIIDNVVKDILKVLLLKLNFDGVLQCIMCRDCSSRLYAAFNFKQMCLYSSNLHFPYLDDKKSSPGHCDQVSMKEEEGIVQVAGDEKKCRLCIQKYIRHEEMAVPEIPVEDICAYFPEINFGITKDQEICHECFETLCIHSSFLKNCSDAEFYKNYGVVKSAISIDMFIKMEEVEIKSEGNERDSEQSRETGNSFVPSANLISDESNETYLEDQTHKCEFRCEPLHKSAIEDHVTIEMDSSGVQIYDCNICTNKSRRMVHFSMHQLVHKDLSKVQMYKCDECEFEAQQKNYLTKHQVIHKNPSEAQKYRCGECEYETNHRYCLKNHQLRHKDSSEVYMYKCDQCSFETKRKSNLTRHLLTHKDPSGMKTYRCGECAYETRREYNLRVHESKHKGSATVQMGSGTFLKSTNFESDAVNKEVCLEEQENKCDKPGDVDGELELRTVMLKDNSGIQLYSCDMCTYKTKRRSNFSTHQLKHKDPSEVQMYKCDRCNFETKQKCNLTKHQMRHRNPSELKMYKCEKCDYKSIERAILKRHQQRYKHFPETQTYKCEKCPYESKCKNDFTQHLSLHENRLYQCEQCEYVTNRRYNLKKHQLRHKDSSEVQMYKCDKCSYESKRKNDLLVHQLTHKDPLEEPLYQCGQCPYGTSRRIGLKRHQLQHKDSSEVQMFKCPECNYQNKAKRNLKSHQLRHHNPANVQV